MINHTQKFIALFLFTALSGCAQMDTQSNMEPVYVSLRESNQIAYYPGQQIWQGGPKMLYTALTPDGAKLVVSSPKDGGIYIFDAHSGNQLAMVKTGKAAKGVKISPDGKEAYVSNEAGNTVSVVDLAQAKTVAQIKTDDMPHNVRFSNDGKQAYVTLQGGAGLGVIDTQSRTINRVIPTPGVGTPHNLDLSTDGRYAYIRDTSNQVGVLDLQNDTLKTIIKVGQGHAGIDVIPNGKLVFTGAIADDVVSVIDTKSNQVIKQIKVGFGPHGVRASADNRFVYVSVTADDKFVVIDVEKLEVIEQHSVSSFPFWVAVKGNP